MLLAVAVAYFVSFWTVASSPALQYRPMRR